MEEKAPRGERKKQNILKSLSELKGKHKEELARGLSRVLQESNVIS